MKKVFVVLEVIDSRIADIHHIYDNLAAAKEKVAENPEHFVIEERSVLSDSSLLQSFDDWVEEQVIQNSQNIWAETENSYLRAFFYSDENFKRWFTSKNSNNENIETKSS